MRLLSQLARRDDLLAARRTLCESISVPQTERRRASRARIPSRRRSIGAGKAVLLDLSESGMAVRVPERCWFARGEAHRLTLRVGLDSVDMEGKVRWTQSAWEIPSRAEDRGYFQTAGLALADTIAPETQEFLSILRQNARGLAMDIEVRASKLTKESS